MYLNCLFIYFSVLRIYSDYYVHGTKKTTILDHDSDRKYNCCSICFLFLPIPVNLPPTLAKSQVSSVRKNLKVQLLSLLKHPSSMDLVQQITTLLIDLGASQSEVI